MELVPELIEWSAIFIAFYEDIGRGERIRTSGPCLPKAVLYQAELHSVLRGIFANAHNKRYPVGLIPLGWVPRKQG